MITAKIKKKKKQNEKQNKAKKSPQTEAKNN